jgi:Ig-like domain-containing protein
MILKNKYALLAAIVCLALVLGSCAPAVSNESVIATSVALTVGAQNTRSARLTATAAALAPSPTPSATPTTTAATKAPPTAPSGGPGSFKPCYSAEFVADVTIPDGTIVSPGATFWKRWSVKNTGSCSWNSTYKFVFMDGDIMGGAYVYPFPGVAGPDQTVEIPIQLYAPTETGSYTGFWKIQAPDKTIFGVGQYDTPLSVNIVVNTGTPGNSKTQTVYDITNVVTHSERRCTSANTFWHIWFDITSNGPVTITFKVVQSDGNGQNNIHLTFTSATTKTFDYGEWSQRFTSSANPRWVQLIETAPTYHEWPKSAPLLLCGT